MSDRMPFDQMPVTSVRPPTIVMDVAPRAQHRRSKMLTILETQSGSFSTRVYREDGSGYDQRFFETSEELFDFIEDTFGYKGKGGKAS